ncbi:hypothetical protein [Hydrogenophaga sp. 2FB]|uniref:hypothetical protein n=1 Tax=Hydrogenophaga sp. 2FB TaxID=2502187 RepID=UPI001BB28A56|nr:hypothetical protein [Hydrogenophaga sp. 2FB]
MATAQNKSEEESLQIIVVSKKWWGLLRPANDFIIVPHAGKQFFYVEQEINRC